MAADDMMEGLDASHNEASEPKKEESAVVALAKKLKVPESMVRDAITEICEDYMSEG